MMPTYYSDCSILHAGTVSPPILRTAWLGAGKWSAQAFVQHERFLSRPFLPDRSSHQRPLSGLLGHRRRAWISAVHFRRTADQRS